MLAENELLISIAVLILMINTAGYFFMVYLSRRSGCWPDWDKAIEFEQGEKTNAKLSQIMKVSEYKIKKHCENDITWEASYKQSVIYLSDINVYSESGRSPFVSDSEDVTVLEEYKLETYNSACNGCSQANEYTKEVIQEIPSPAIPIDLKKQNTLVTTSGESIGEDEIDYKSVASLKNYPSFSWASRKGVPRYFAWVFIAPSACATVFFAYQLPISNIPKHLIVIGATGCSLAPIFNLKDEIEGSYFSCNKSLCHYLVAGTAFLCCTCSALTATYDLWSSKWIVNSAMLMTGIWIFVCTMLLGKWLVFEWLLMWMLSSWYPIIYLIHVLSYDDE